MTREDFAGRSGDLRRPPIAEINALAAGAASRGERLLDLGQAVLGLPPPEKAIAEARRYLEAGGVHPYSPDPGLPEVREAVAAHCRRAKAILDAEASQVLLTCGANQAFVNTVLTLTRPGDQVITFGPGYFDHDFALRLAGCENVEVALELHGDRFLFDVEAVRAAVTDRTRAVVLVSPGNPTGAVISRGALDELVDLCRRRGLWLVSDETYDLLTFPPARHVSPAALGEWERVVVLGSFSKVFGLAGWRIGYMLAQPWLVQEAIKAQDTVVVCAPVIAQRAALGALSEASAYASRALEILLGRREVLLEILNELDWLTPTVPDGATFVLARLAEGLEDLAICKALVTCAGVVSVPGSAFGTRGAGWVRLSFGNLDRAALAEAGERLRGFRPAP